MVIINKQLLEQTRQLVDKWTNHSLEGIDLKLKEVVCQSENQPKSTCY